MILCWSTTCFNYDMITLYLKYIPGNVFLNTATSSISDSLSSIMAGIIFKFVGTRRGLFFSYILAVISIIGLIIADNMVTDRS